MRDPSFKSMDPIEMGKRLAAVRRARSLSQEEVARHLGVSRPTVVAIEKGTRRVTASELITLSELYGRSVHELLSGRPLGTGLVPQFRLTQVAEVPEKAIASAVEDFLRACEDYLALEALMDAPMPHYRYPDEYSITGLSPQAAAEETATIERSRLNLGQGPLANLLEVLEADVGLRVFVIPLEEFRIAGMFAYTERMGGCILVNGKHPATRQTWSAAHEYAHFLTDRYRSDVTILIDYERKPRSEQFADCFAGSLLMPAGGLRLRFHKIVQSRRDFTVADLCYLADQYAVSVEAMTRRLEGLGCIRRGAWEGLVAQGLQGRREQAHLGIAARAAERLRLPERYRRLAVQAFEEERITETELMRFLRCSRVEARETVEVLTQTQDLDTAGKPYQLALDFGEVVARSPAEREA